AEGGIRDFHVTGVQTCALPIFRRDALVELTLRKDESCVDHPAREPSRCCWVGDRWRLLYEIAHKLRLRVPRAGFLLSGWIDSARSEERRVGKGGGSGGWGGVAQ